MCKNNSQIYMHYMKNFAHFCDMLSVVQCMEVTRDACTTAMNRRDLKKQKYRRFLPTRSQVMTQLLEILLGECL